MTASAAFPGARLIASWFGAGYAPKAPGTVGSLAALPFAYGIVQLGGWIGLAIAAALLLPVGAWVADRVAAGDADHDPGWIVVDEVVGQWIALIPVALISGWVGWIVAVIAFRGFDIAKPGPIAWIDARVKGGWGVMLDDVAAGLAAAAVTAAFLALLRSGTAP